MRLHLVDGTYELYRAHYSPRPDHRDPAGVDPKATVGIVESMLALLHDPDEAVTHVAVVFDNPIRSFRNDMYPPYKSDEGVPPELRAQFDSAERAVRSIGVSVWTMREYEADDGLASGARRFRDQVEQVRILTPDKDLGQCIRGDRVVQVDRRQKKLTNELAFHSERGFGPESMPDFLALTGDSADGFPGLPGFGKKSASMLIGAYEHLEQIPADAALWKVKPRGAPQLSGDTSGASRRSVALPETRNPYRHRAARGFPRRSEVRRCPARHLRTMVRRSRSPKAEKSPQAMAIVPSFYLTLF